MRARVNPEQPTLVIANALGQAMAELLQELTGDLYVKRREFFKAAGGVSVACALGDVVGASEPSRLNAESLFEASRSEVLALAIKTEPQ